MMLSLSAINMLLFSVIAFSYANLFNIVTYTLWNVNNDQSLYRKKGNSSAIKIEPIKNNRKSAEIFQPLCNDFSTINFIFTSNLGLQRGHGILCV